MDLEQLLHKLEEAIDDVDWELVQEVVDEIREEIENPFENYDLDKWDGNN
jgi:hypothetical protein